MHYLSQYDTAQSIKDSLTIAPRNDFDVQLSTLAAELDGVWQIIEGKVSIQWLEISSP